MKARALVRIKSMSDAQWADYVSRVGESRRKSKAHSAVADAKAAGLIAAQPCVVCAESRGVQAHHEDYSRPLDVVWLCGSHHNKRHAELRGQSDHGVWRVIGATEPVLRATAAA